ASSSRSWTESRQEVPVALSRSATVFRLLIGAAWASLLPFSLAHGQGSSTTPPAAPAPTDIARPEQPSAQSEAKEEKEAEQPAVANKSVVSREAIENERPQTAFDALKNVPGVVNSDTKGGGSDDFYIRGIHLSETTSYRMNGSSPLENNIGLMDDKARVEALKGVGALIYGLAPPAGIINLVTKRATAKPVTALTFAGTSFGQYGAQADIGRKFGDRNEFGTRVNLSATHLEKGISGASGQRFFGSLAGDWQMSRKLSFHLDVEGYQMRVIEQAVVRQLNPVGGVISLPRIPDPSLLLSGPWAQYRTYGFNLLGSIPYQIADGWNVIAEAGWSHATRAKRYITRF